MSTQHFTDRELACPDCDRLPPQDFQDFLEGFRLRWGRPMVISSGFRCPERNLRVSKTGIYGPHTIGAVDVLVSGPAVYGFILAAMHYGWTGIGIHQRGPMEGRFVHLDVLQDDKHPRPRIWTY